MASQFVASRVVPSSTELVKPCNHLLSKMKLSNAVYFGVFARLVPFPSVSDSTCCAVDHRTSYGFVVFQYLHVY
jgi:hypothetical protein